MSYSVKRENMVQGQIRPFGITKQNILKAFLDTPKEEFVPVKYKEVTYTDIAIPIDKETSILENKIIAKALEELNIQDSDTALVVGTKLGYVAALLSLLAKNVVCLETNSQLFELAKSNFERLGIRNITQIHQDSYTQFNNPSKENYINKIFINGSCDIIPKSLFDILVTGGKIFAIVGSEPRMFATVYTKIDDKKIGKDILLETCAQRIIKATNPNTFNF